MRSIPWGCAILLFRCEAFGGYRIMFLVRETFPSNKWCSCPSRVQLEFFERSVTYFQRNGVIERIVTYFNSWELDLCSRRVRSWSSCRRRLVVVVASSSGRDYVQITSRPGRKFRASWKCCKTCCFGCPFAVVSLRCASVKCCKTCCFGCPFAAMSMRLALRFDVPLLQCLCTVPV